MRNPKARPALKVVPTSRRAVKSPLRLSLFVGLCVLGLAGGFWVWQQRSSATGVHEVVGPSPERGIPLPIETKQPDQALAERLATLSNLPKLRTGIFLSDLTTGSYVTQEATASYPAASTIKIPVLLALLQDIELGQAQWNETLAITKATQVSGSGVLKGKPLGTRLRLWELADLMISESDNIASELLIERLGGREQLNQRFRWWGLTQTSLNAPLPDIEGKNRTSPQDLAIALSYIDRGIGISPWNRDRALDFMRRVVNRNFFVKGLAKVEPTARIAHKTGTIGLGIGDAGLIDLPSGRRFILVALIERPREDRRAVEVMQGIAAQVTASWSTPAGLPVP